jgi:hypothetical protein
MNEYKMPKAIKRIETENSLKAECLGSITVRVDRYLELNVPALRPNHHFAPVTAECILLYRDGYFFACISLCQAIAEAIVRLLCEKNKEKSPNFNKGIAKLRKLRNDIPEDWIRILQEIWKDRNNYHHLNPKVPTEKRKLEKIAKSKIGALFDMERMVFAFDLVGGAVAPKYPKYWNEPQNGMLNIFLTIEP